MPRMKHWVVVLAVLVGLLAPSLVASAQVSSYSYFNTTWERTDKPVADGVISRTWMWGPIDSAFITTEPYLESPNGQRQVAYFDKSRMEISHPQDDQNSIWYVTNGLLSVELISGQMQTGESRFEQRHPAQINVAGDTGDPTGPTYASFSAVLSGPATPLGNIINQRISRNGTVTFDPVLAHRSVSAAYFDDVTNHTVAQPFWDFMNAIGTVYQHGVFATDALFQNPYFATGRPITEAYWANVQVASIYQDVLVQCFERRCLTYTPDNPAGWQVEAGNVGQHYYSWRYGTVSPPNPPTNPSLSEEEYLETITGIYTELGTSISFVMHLLAEGDPNDPSVSATIASELASWRPLALSMNEIHPPDAYTQLHTTLLAGYSYILVASDSMHEGFTTKNSATFIYGVEQLDIGWPMLVEAFEGLQGGSQPPLAESEYLDLIWAIDDELLYSVDYFLFLIENMDLSDYTWIDAYFNVLDTWRYLAFLIYEIVPPASYSEIHDLMIIAYLYIFDAAEKLATALAESDVSVFEQGLESLFTSLAILDEVFVFIPSEW